MNANRASTPQSEQSSHTHHAVGEQACGDEYGTLIVDDRGRICGSGAAADSLFGAGHGRITGRLIAEFIPGILRDRGSPGRSARSPAASRESRDWQHFEAMDALGRSFAIRIRVSRRLANGEDVLLLNFCRPGQTVFSPTASKVAGEIVSCQD